MMLLLSFALISGEVFTLPERTSSLILSTILRDVRGPKSEACCRHNQSVTLQLKGRLSFYQVRLSNTSQHHEDSKVGQTELKRLM